MGKSLREFIDVVLLIVFLAIGAGFTMSAIHNIQGSQPNLATDKVTLSGAASDNTLNYTVDDVLLLTSRFDLSMPLDRLVITIDGRTFKTYDCKSTAVLTDKYLVARDIIGQKPTGVDFKTFYTYPVEMSLATSSLTGNACTINIITAKGGIS